MAYRLNGLEFEQALGDSERQGALACCSSQGGTCPDTTEQLNNNKKWDDPEGWDGMGWDGMGWGGRWERVFFQFKVIKLIF